MSQNDEKFYLLTPETGKKLREAGLTAAEWRIWSYLVELDPFGDRYVEFETLETMQVCDCSKVTFYRAIAKFQELGLFDFQDKGICFKNETGVSKMKLQFQKRNRSFKNETGNSKMKPEFQNCKNRGLKPSPEAASRSPQTYSDFKEDPDSLSEGKFPDFLERVPGLPEGERENFFSFCFRKAAELPQPPVLVEKWIECHSQQLVEVFRRENSVSLNGKDPDRGQEKSAAAYTPEEIEAILQRSIEETARRRAAKGGTYDT